MRSVRVIPCLDVDTATPLGPGGGRVVKGVRFVDLVDAGDPVELAARYDAEGADEVVFLDITASADARQTMVELARRTAEEVFIPFTVGGGVRTPDDARAQLRAGPDKVAVNTAAVARPEVVSELAKELGAQCVVVAIDARRNTGSVGRERSGSGFEVFTHGGRRATGIDAVAWAAECEREAPRGRRRRRVAAGGRCLRARDRRGRAERHHRAGDARLAQRPRSRRGNRGGGMHHRGQGLRRCGGELR